MPNATNKVKFNLKNVHVAKLTEQENGTFSFGTPKAFPGAVNLSLNSEGESTPFYADDIVFYRSTANNGYTGDFEAALVPDWFREEYLKEILDSEGVLCESANITDPQYFAMMFEFAGDKHKIRHVMYKCSVSRPPVASQTREAANTPVTETLSITCDPLVNGMVKSKTTADTTTTVYNKWFTEVYVPNLTEDQLNGGGTTAKLSTLALGSVSLTPTFDPDTTEYTAETSNATNTITATAGTGLGVAITVNGNSIASGSSVTWEDGENDVRITVSGTGYSSTTYTVLVTAEGD